MPNARFLRFIGARPGQRGVAAVELAIILPLMLLIAAGIVEFARAFWYYNALDKASRDAARYVSMLSATDRADAAKVAAAFTTAKSLAVTEANGANVNPVVASSNIDITSAICPSATGNYDCVGVRVVDFSFLPGTLFPFVGAGTLGAIPLQPATTMRYMN
jgi:Flp pilus assembly protein TadG